jgi:hypothetical protein
MNDAKWAGSHFGEGIGEGAADPDQRLRDMLSGDPDRLPQRTSEDYLVQFGSDTGSLAGIHDRAAAEEYLARIGLQPTPDAIGQLTEVFLPCLRIMCDPDHPWDPNGATWRRGGIFAVLTDARKKWERFWERTWTHGKRHDDSGFDLINFVGFVMRAKPESRWGEWGEPGRVGDR